MAYLFLSLLSLCAVVTTALTASNLPKIEMAYLGLYKGLMERCVLVADEEGEYRGMPVFYMPMVEEAVAAHFESNLAPYCQGYTHRVYQPWNLDMGIYARTVVVAFDAKVNDGMTVRKRAVFEIKEVFHG